MLLDHIPRDRKHNSLTQRGYFDNEGEKKSEARKILT